MVIKNQKYFAYDDYFENSNYDEKKKEDMFNLKTRKLVTFMLIIID